MGDHLGVHSGHEAKAETHTLPDSVVSMADDFAKTWLANVTACRLDSAADAMSDLDDDGNASGQLPQHTSDATARWLTVRESAAWKDHEFLRTLRSDAPSGTG
jgi:hypothetical protein